MSEVEELREVVREAHAAIKDATRLLCEVKDAKAQLESTSDQVFDALMSDAIERGLERYGNAIKDAISDATKDVHNKFDELGDTLLGRTKAARRRGMPNIDDMATVLRVLESLEPNTDPVTALGVGLIKPREEKKNESGGNRKSGLD